MPSRRFLDGQAFRQHLFQPATSESCDGGGRRQICSSHVSFAFALEHLEVEAGGVQMVQWHAENCMLYTACRYATSNAIRMHGQHLVTMMMDGQERLHCGNIKTIMEVTCRGCFLASLSHACAASSSDEKYPRCRLLPSNRILRRDEEH